MFEGNKDDKVKGRSLILVIWVEVGTGVGPCDGVSSGSYVLKLEESGERYSITTGGVEWS